MKVDREAQRQLLDYMAEKYATNEDEYFDYIAYRHYLAGALAALEQPDKQNLFSRATAASQLPTDTDQLALSLTYNRD
jgi:hypothetical protein